MNRCGVTLVELLLAMALLVMVAAGVVLVVRTAARETLRSENALATDRIRTTVVAMLFHDLADVAAADVSLHSPSVLGISRPVGEALPCRDTGDTIIIAAAEWAGTRAPQAGRDMAWLLADSTLSRWDSLPLLGVSTSRCDDGRAAIALLVAAHPPTAALRIREPVDWSAYLSTGADWFGFTPADHSSSVQPFAGPLAIGGARFALASGSISLVIPPQGVAPVALAWPLAP